ncbi:MAG: HEXXH motif-containing putative peptide modification protein [Polyangiaceae bacterium]
MKSRQIVPVGTPGTPSVASFDDAMTALPVGFLALPGPGDRATATLRRKLALTLLHDLLTASPRVAGSTGHALGRLQSFVTDTLRGPARGRLLAGLDCVDVMVPLLAAKSGQLALDAALRAAVPSWLASLAHDPAAPPDFVWDVPVERVFLRETSTWIELTTPAQGMSLTSGKAELRLASGAPLDLDAVELPAGVERAGLGVAIDDPSGPLLALADSNPLFALEEHPEKSGNRLELSGYSPDDWGRDLGEALQLVRECLPDLGQEIHDTLQRIVPVGYHAERHFSASYREAPGLIYMSLHPSTLTLAEAIVHETQHGKLNLARWFDPLLANGDSVWTESAVRPDLRPLTGVLLAVHAFVPVAALHERIASRSHPLAASDAFGARRREVLAANARGLETLKREGEPTELGRRVLGGLEELHAHLMTAYGEPLAQGSLERLG